MQETVRGPFDVQLAPLPHSAGDDAPLLARRAIDKRFHGALEATSKGEMLSAGTAVQGSAGYVALEQVTGTLNGRRGGFVLQHAGLMDRGAPSLDIRVVPDSGTGELVGLVGTMKIVIEQGRHSYELEYRLPE